MAKANSYFEMDGDILRLKGEWIIDHSADIVAALKTAEKGNIRGIDAAPIEKLDLWGGMRLRQLADASNAELNLNDHQKQIFAFLPDKSAKRPAHDEDNFLVEIVEGVGQASISFLKTSHAIISFIGEIGVCFMRNLRNPRLFRFHSIMRHIYETGLQALPIIGLLSVLISMVIAYQASIQLSKFGASIFTVDLLVISLLREMGVLVTAIMVAGRSGSAFAAEIGVMKLREEVDALKTMGFNPIEILVLPRLIAMMITLPILAFLADIIGLLGGGIISIILLDIPFDMYVDRVSSVAKPTMFFVGLIKAPVFAFVITIIGAYQGMNVSGSAESVGRLTTVAVVQSIFLVIMLDALFSIIFANMGI
jgi:phospholipid/cholesterol/gamma-HCH transport system permease protein